MKTKEELNAIKEELNTLNAKLAELTEDELNEISGGNNSFFIFPLVKGDPLRDMGDPLRDMGDPLRDMGDPLRNTDPLRAMGDPLRNTDPLRDMGDPLRRRPDPRIDKQTRENKATSGIFGNL